MEGSRWKDGVPRTARRTKLTLSIIRRVIHEEMALCAIERKINLNAGVGNGQSFADELFDDARESKKARAGDA